MIRPNKFSKIQWPKSYQDASEKVAAQVKFAADGKEIFNYVAGLPFPTIEGNDPLTQLLILARQTLTVRLLACCRTSEFRQKLWQRIGFRRLHNSSAVHSPLRQL